MGLIAILEAGRRDFLEATRDIPPERASGDGHARRHAEQIRETCEALASPIANHRPNGV